MTKQVKEVAYRDGTVAIENLPYQIVYYPGHYGTFFAFQKRSGDDLYLCSCSKKAIKNYIKHRRENEIPRYTDSAREFILDSMYFPLKLVNELMKKEYKSDKKVFESLKFKDGLCHECNKAVPSYTYCHPMYGAAFKQNFGWYIGKQIFEYGIWYDDVNAKRPSKLEKLYLSALKARKKFDQKIDGWQRKHPNSIPSPRLAEKELKEYNEKSLPVTHYVENVVRDKFGYPRIGEGWVSETILFKTIKRLFPSHEIIHNYRPEFLRGLEIDIFIKGKNIAVEYQGLQHFNPVKHWGGEEGLKSLKERDKIKKDACAKNGIPLVYFYYDESISEGLVMDKLRKYIKNSLSP